MIFCQYKFYYIFIGFFRQLFVLERKAAHAWNLINSLDSWIQTQPIGKKRLLTIYLFSNRSVCVCVCMYVHALCSDLEFLLRATNNPKSSPSSHGQIVQGDVCVCVCVSTSSVHSYHLRGKTTRKWGAGRWEMAQILCSIQSFSISEGETEDRPLSVLSGAALCSGNHFPLREKRKKSTKCFLHVFLCVCFFCDYTCLHVLPEAFIENIWQNKSWSHNAMQ